MVVVGMVVLVMAVVVTVVVTVVGAVVVVVVVWVPRLGRATAGKVYRARVRISMMYSAGHIGCGTITDGTNRPGFRPHVCIRTRLLNQPYYAVLFVQNGVRAGLPRGGRSQRVALRCEERRRGSSLRGGNLRGGAGHGKPQAPALPKRGACNTCAPRVLVWKSVF